MNKRLLFANKYNDKKGGIFMDDKKDFRNNGDKKEEAPLEIPENSPSGEAKPIKNKRAMSRIKAA